MIDVTLVIPAKNESESLPKVLDELKKFDVKKIVVMSKNDLDTFNSIKNYNVRTIFQKGNGFGNALRTGIQSVETKFFCVFNADGSFDPKYLKEMLKMCEKVDYVFATRYLKDGGSEDDTFITRFGNFFFSTLGNILFSLNLSDILFTFILGKKLAFKSLNLKSSDFCLCVEIPINAKRISQKYSQISSKERKRIAGLKKVNEFKDGLKILTFMILKFLRIK